VFFAFLTTFETVSYDQKNVLLFSQLHPKPRPTMPEESDFQKQNFKRFQPGRLDENSF
jgi:hypothetical protein